MTKRISQMTPNHDSLNSHSSHYCYLVPLAVDLGETYPDVLFEASSNVSGFIHYDSGVRCGSKPIIQMSLQIDLSNERFEY